MSFRIYRETLSRFSSLQPALRIYGIQLAVNFFWSILFFCLQAYWFAFVWLILLWVLILAMIVSFAKVSFPAAMLQNPLSALGHLRGVSQPSGRFAQLTAVFPFQKAARTGRLSERAFRRPAGFHSTAWQSPIGYSQVSALVPARKSAMCFAQ
ncbi:TspO/MBR family protein [Anaeromassilibacillus sp. SJQ-1]|uniref:TspO/MBR family protein n=1 Tax=Anaeromassilibacillus sp. SJQ-1 TaxID=3375419 RepID=UPI003988F24A